jgi:hypothetical protein
MQNWSGFWRRVLPIGAKGHHLYSSERMTPSQPSILVGSLAPWGRILLVLFLFNGLGAVAGGIGVMKDVLPFPVVWLQGTPFHSYFLPGLILCLAVGGSQLAAAFAMGLASLSGQGRVCNCGIRADWMEIGELVLIGFQAPIQVWFLALGLIEVGLSFTKLRRASAVTA